MDQTASTLEDSEYFKPTEQITLIKSVAKNFNDWLVGPNYIVERILGTGSYGSVCRAVQVSTGNKVAIKRL